MTDTLIMCDKEKMMTEGSLYEVLDVLLSNPNDGEITFNVNAVKEIRDELKNAEETIGRLMLEVNRLHSEIAELEVHAQTVKNLINRKALVKFLFEGTTALEEYEKWKTNEAL